MFWPRTVCGGLNAVAASLALSCFFLTPCAAVPPVKGEATEPVLQLAVSSRKFEVGDPLLACVTITNGTSLPVEIRKHFSSGSGLVQFRIRIDDEWQVLRAYGQGTKCYVNSAFQLRPGESRSTIETLFLDEFSPVFSAPGKFEIRAVVEPGPHRYVSDSIPIEVNDGSAEKLAYLKDHYRNLRIQADPFRFHDLIGDARFARLSDCLLKRQLQWDEVFYRWASDGHGMQEGPEWDAVRQLIPKLDAVNRDRFWFAIASAHYRKKEYPEVLKALDQMQDPTKSALFLRGESERALAPPAPQAPP